MIQSIPRIAAWALAAGMLLDGCARQPAQADPASPPPGTISVPFRNRWWHFYERGLSWAAAGHDAEAEADFRQCLRLRQTDSRFARTYGMHFVQCFAHRELGAVLLRQGRRVEAERELRMSLQQEPSAKAEWLLQHPDGAGPAAQAAPAGPAARPDGILVASIAAAPAERLRVSGRIEGEAERALWAIDPAGAATRVPTGPAGAFATETAAGAILALGDATGPDQAAAPSLRLVEPQAEVRLSIDGPDDGTVVGDGKAWYRWSATAAAGLARLEVDDAAGDRLASLGLGGVQAAGTLRLTVPGGAQVLRFRVRSASGGEGSAERRVDSRPTPQQDRALRAVAVVLPLQAPRPGAMRAGDDPRLRSALVDDGRFRFVDLQADEVLARELALVEAGYVDRSTAAAAGRRLASRYVIAATMTRAGHDAECFLRLIHCDSGRQVASADAYAVVSSDGEADALFAASAGRLRQAFPISDGAVAASGGSVRFAFGARAGLTALMQVHVFPAPPADGQGGRPAALAEVTAVEPAAATGSVQRGSAPAAGWGISE